MLVTSLHLKSRWASPATRQSEGVIFFKMRQRLSFHLLYFGTTTLAPGFDRLPDGLPNKLESQAFGNFGGLFASGLLGVVGD